MEQQDTAQSPAAKIAIQGLGKSFGLNQVLQNINLELGAGHIVGLIGPNSGGKSTLLRHLVGIYLPSRGQCSVFGTEAGQLSDRGLARIGYVHQEVELLEWMCVNELVRYVAAHYSTWNNNLEAELIELFNLKRNERVAVMSPGQKQKLSILLAVCFEPELLILDEPASALDPIARKDFLELLLKIIQDQNRTIIISSHILADVEKVIDHVLVMNDGRITWDCGFDELLEEFIQVEITAPKGELPINLPFRSVISSQQDDTQAVLTMRRMHLDKATLDQHPQWHVATRQLGLEEIYPLLLKSAQSRIRQ